MTELLTPHPMREMLNDEVHARPPAHISAPARLSSLTLFFERDSSGQLEAVLRLAQMMGAPAPDSRRKPATIAIAHLPHRGSHGFSGDRPCWTQGS